jgi:phosphohistidine phosphatase
MVVNLYIMRHGDAQPYATSDEVRQLTPRGIAEVKKNGEWLKQKVSGFDLVLVSPYVRAQQTQQIICDMIETPTKLETTEDLVPEGSPENIHDYIDAAIQLDHPKNILLVSHMPLVSYLVEELSIDRISPIFPTAGIAYIEYNVQQMRGHFSTVKAP